MTSINRRTTLGSALALGAVTASVAQENAQMPIKGGKGATSLGPRAGHEMSKSPEGEIRLNSST
jgi:hypothetical protein